MKLQINCPRCKRKLTVGNPGGNNTCQYCKERFNYYVDLALNKVVTEIGYISEGEYKRRLLWCNNHRKCHYCRKHIKYQESTLDHVVPTSKGSTDGLHNLVISCSSCNNTKGNEDYRSFVRQEVRTVYREYPPVYEYVKYLVATLIRKLFVWNSKVCYFLTLM